MICLKGHRLNVSAGALFSKHINRKMQNIRKDNILKK